MSFDWLKIVGKKEFEMFDFLDVFFVISSSKLRRREKFALNEIPNRHRTEDDNLIQ